MTAREAYILLNMTEGLGPVRVRALCDAFGTPDAVLGASEEELLRIHRIGPKVIASIFNTRDTKSAADEEDRAAALGARLVTLLDAEYPAPLKEIYDPPLCLYVRGELTGKDAQAVAIVGTRRATYYGTTQADRLAFQLAKAGFTVVSGLARGIDTAAHQGALKGGGRTIAVLGGALDCLYPPENQGLAEQIEGAGAVISEFPLGRSPDRTTFPFRNRIISGLSKGVLVVESDMRGGGMQTASLALEQGRSVMAVPGRVDQSGSHGPHNLIKNGARLVEDIDDILREFEFLFPPAARAEVVQGMDPRRNMELSAAERKIIRALWEEELDVDSLIRKTGLPASQIHVLALQMEMRRLVKMLPGRRMVLREDIRSWGLPPEDEA